MWLFKGNYSGEAKAYVKRQEKKQVITLSLIFSIVILVIFIGMAIAFGEGDITLILIILGCGAGLIALMNVILFLLYKREIKCEIEITNDSFHVYKDGSSFSFAFYKIDTIEYYDDFIVIAVKNIFKSVLQKDLLSEGSWEDLKNLLKKIEDSLNSEDPLYQIEEPPTECFEATVKEKRIYEKFSTEFFTVAPTGSFQYFATFALENEKEVEYEIGQEWYEKIEKEQTGTLVIVNGNFFAFGEGEDIQ